MLKSGRKHQPFPLVAFFAIGIEAPALSAYAEHKIYERTDWKEQIGNDKILGIQYISSTDQMETGPEIVSQNARHTCNENENTVYQNRLFTGPVEIID